jgi:threonyl-tRNA synthetase
MIDHRRLGRELDYFHSDPLVGAGLPIWLPDGAAVRHAIENYVRDLERRNGYRHVYSPPLARRELFEMSGHLAHYSDDMFPPMPDGGAELFLRPSLCPHHALVFASRGRSYRELPLRVAELGPMYREERSGVLGGLSRVRAVSLNDAHIFCSEEQAVDEVREVFRLMHQAHEAVRMRPLRYRLSLPSDGNEKYAAHGGWRKAADMLRQGLGDIPYEEAPGEAAFYGPKIDVQIADPAGREQTLSTVQIDYFQPERFGLSYVASVGDKSAAPGDGERPERRPVMIHRSLLGSMERLIAHLLEIHDGWLPDWCAPVQVVVLPVHDSQLGAAREFVDKALARGLRAECRADGSLGLRVRQAAERRVPHVAVIGEREAAAGAVALRGRDAQPADVALEILVDSCEVPLRG